MQLYLAKQGLALSSTENPKEPLSDEGRIGLQKLSSFLARSRFSISKVLHSKELCAKQTAIILSQGLGAGRLVQECPVVIEREDRVKHLFEFVHNVSDNVFNEGTLIVGHASYLSRFLGSLICADERLPVVRFEPGIFVALEYNKITKKWLIQWVVQPSLLGI